MQEVQATGNEVLLVMTIPHFSITPYQLDYGRCSVWAILGDVCTQAMPQEVTDRVQGNLRTAIANAAASTDAGVLDLRDYFCPNSMCASRQCELVLYADAGHVSVAASEALAGRFAQRISESSSSTGAGPAGG